MPFYACHFCMAVCQDLSAHCAECHQAGMAFLYENCGECRGELLRRMEPGLVLAINNYEVLSAHWRAEGGVEEHMLKLALGGGA